MTLPLVFVSRIGAALPAAVVVLERFATVRTNTGVAGRICVVQRIVSDIAVEIPALGVSRVLIKERSVGGHESAELGGVVARAEVV